MSCNLFGTEICNRKSTETKYQNEDHESKETDERSLSLIAVHLYCIHISRKNEHTVRENNNEAQIQKQKKRNEDIRDWGWISFFFF